MHFEQHTELDNLIAMQNLRTSSNKGSNDAYDVSVSLTGLTPIPATMASEPTSGTVHVRERSRSPRRHDEEPLGLSSVDFSHQFGFRDATLWCWRCGGWSPGSRRASRLKDPCGIPTKKGADVIFRVSGGNPPKAHEWRSDDVSRAPERIPIHQESLQQQVQTTSSYPRRQLQVNFWAVLLKLLLTRAWFVHLAPISQVVVVPLSCPSLVVSLCHRVTQLPSRELLLFITAIFTFY